MKNTFLFLCLIEINLIFAQTYKKVEIFFNSPKEFQQIADELDHVHKNSPNSVTAFLSESELKIIEEKGFRTKTLIDDWNKYYNEKIIPANNEFQENQLSSLKKSAPANFDYGTMGGYYKLEEVYQRLDKMYQQFPNLITEKQSIGKTNENREIYFVKISDSPNVDEIDEKQVMFTALHHAREPESMMQMIYFMWYLLENYEKDSAVKYLVDNREIYFVPVVNPDGYFYNQTTNPSGGGMWRKNRRDNGDGTYGVDLNRNYGPMEYWNSPNGGSSLTPSSDTYRGTAPFSEPETNAIKEFLHQHKIKNCLNYHTYSNLLIYPYGALGKETPDSLIYRSFAKDMTQFNNYVYGTDDQTVGYTTRGNSDDYFYDGDTVSNGKIFAMTPEVGGGADGFWPLQSRIIPLAEENIFPNLYWLWIADGYVNANGIVYNKTLFNPDDTVTVSIKIKNKGLGNIENVNVNIESIDQSIKVISNPKTISQMSSQEELMLNNDFKFVIAPSALPGDVIGLNVVITKNSIELSRQGYSFSIGTPKNVFSDNIEITDTLWDFTKSSWGVISNEFYSEYYSLTDSPSGYYPPDYHNAIALKTSVDLSNIEKPHLSFYTKFEIEEGWDYGQVLISSDSGSSWNAVGGNLSSVGSGNFQPNGEIIYDGKVDEWTKEEIDLSDFAGKKILIKFALSSDTYVEYDGWYIDDINVYYYMVTSLRNDPNELMSFRLEQNYPNPFNPATEIKFRLKVNSKVTLNVYNVIGEKVATLINKDMSAGYSRVAFNGSNLANGIYFYRIEASGVDGSKFVDTKKMILIK